MLNTGNGQPMYLLVICALRQCQLTTYLPEKELRHKSGNVPTSFDVCMKLEFCVTVHFIFLSLS